MPASSFPARYRRATLWLVLLAVVGALTLGPQPAHGAPDLTEPLVLRPGVTENSAVPERWDLDLRELDRPAAEQAADGLSSRLYGTSRGVLHEPITIRTDYAAEVVVGIHVAAAAIQGAELRVEAAGTTYGLSWPRADASHRPNTLYWFRLPAGDQTVSFSVVDSNGVVVVAGYHYLATVDDLPDDVPAAPLPVYVPPDPLENTQLDGYRGIWFTLGQFSEYGDKYSGGLGTYTMKHTPLAVYAPEVDKTFFTYGGTLDAGGKYLLNMASSYDHATHTVTRPTVVHDKGKDGVVDPHDNASLQIAGDGHIWMFVSGRAQGRPGFKYRSVAPYNVDEFELVTTEEMTYPQPMRLEGQGFLHLFTKYTNGRELYWETSDVTGRTWSADHKLAGFGGHYQVSAERQGLVASAFNYHPGGNVDRRTNLYYVQSADAGTTWRTVAGTQIATPLSAVANPALVVDYAAQGLLVYLKEVTFDRSGNPVILYVTSRDHRPGPAGDPRVWHVAHWDGTAWKIHDITTSDHNYDSGSIYVDGGEWTVVAPTDPGPQVYQTGGELVQWRSTDAGATWQRTAQITQDSPANHGYARRPLGVRDPFYAFWADGDPTRFGPSRIYFGDRSGRRVWRLPEQMTEDTARPVAMFDDPCDPPDPSPTVMMGEVDSGVPNRHAGAGCSVDDLIRDEDRWDNRPAFLEHVRSVTGRLAADGFLTDRERAAVTRAAARSSIGR